ncbi:hypothetical protein F5B22DRAFT_604986 [Xylaria bambusicola]|uniref:uncharacterized protein n=1 Tax=Xylaria bambusicola TaxID=326684 RepID=UPI00200781F1|nr:uncharacterized protein F5B22DRAFT_604986 [Xylaria bambusicola]KAI0517129.1 hypothetical protein F5B22DRAFT_604986 [Xylaria bambusicola]
MASVAPVEPAARATRHPHKTRKRASKACLSCRARKVRCDVSQRGRPCMNCYLDDEACIVTSRASRFRKGERQGSVLDFRHQDHVDDCTNERRIDGVANSGVNVEPASPQEELANDIHITENGPTLRVPGFGVNTGEDMQQDQQPSIELNGHQPSFNRPLNPAPPFHSAPSMPMPSFDSIDNSEIPFMVGQQQVIISADITYSYYPFISISNLHNVMPQDVNYLDSQGCLRIPTRAILDEFMQQYFLHVHPLMPFLNEGDFWNLYCHQGSGGSSEKMSLLVFQAMMFSCCNFVSKTSIKALGFPDIRTARATLYRRTKLLFDFDTESSLVCVAQAALLLTYWAPNWSLAPKKPNTAWLGVAIQNAKSAEAHIYSAMPTFSPVTEPKEYKKQNSLKRLWWCCLIRDRLLALGMRRSIQVSPAHFDVTANSRFSCSDLADEVGASKVYNPETKQHLIEIFVKLGELSSVLTDLLTLVFPLDDVPGWGRHNGAEGAERVKESKAALRRWYKAASLRFPMPGGSQSKMAGNQNLQHDSVILYTNLMYMFYHSARAALCHHEVLQATMASASPNPNNNGREFSNVHESRHELQDAACGVTECLNDLIQRRLARWLPIPAIACTAMPLVLHIIDVKLLSQNKQSRATPDEKRRTAIKQQRLNVLIEAMKTYQPQYDGVDYISETIRHIVNLAQIDPPSSQANGPSSFATPPENPATSMQPMISSWTDMLASNPGSYLRLSMTMDISMSKGRLAKETDFPAKLRGLFAQGFSSIRALLAESHARTSPAQHTFTSTAAAPAVFLPNPAAHIQPGSVHSVSSDEDPASPDSPDNAAGTLESTNNDSGITSHNAQIPDAPFFSALDTDVAMHIHTDMFVESGGSTNLDMDYSLTTDALAPAFTPRADNNGSNATSNHKNNGDNNTADNEMYDAEDEAREADWIERAWDEETGDKETARVLLDALQNDAVLCA